MENHLQWRPGQEAASQYRQNMDTSSARKQSHTKLKHHDIHSIYSSTTVIPEEQIQKQVQWSETIVCNNLLNVGNGLTFSIFCKLIPATRSSRLMKLLNCGQCWRCWIASRDMRGVASDSFINQLIPVDQFAEWGERERETGYSGEY